MSGWEEGAQHGIWREAGCVGGRDLAGGRICGWEKGAINGIWREAGCVGGRGGSTKRDLAEAGCVGGRGEHKMGFDERQDVWVGGRSTCWKAECVGGRTDHKMAFDVR